MKLVGWMQAFCLAAACGAAAVPAQAEWQKGTYQVNGKPVCGELLILLEN